MMLSQLLVTFWGFGPSKGLLMVLRPWISHNHHGVLGLHHLHSGTIPMVPVFRHGWMPMGGSRELSQRVTTRSRFLAPVVLLTLRQISSRTVSSAR